MSAQRHMRQLAGISKPRANIRDRPINSKKDNNNKNEKGEAPKEDMPPSEIMCVMSLDDMRLSSQDLNDLFARFMVIADSNPDMLVHLKSLLSYLQSPKKRRRWYNNDVTRPTHVVFMWGDGTPRMRLLAQHSPFSLLKRGVDSAVSQICGFMLYLPAIPNVNVLNWYHTGGVDDPHYLPRMREAIGLLKIKYLVPRSGFNFMIADVAPIYETLVWFGLFMDFFVEGGDGEVDHAFLDAYLSKDLDSFREIVESSRYRTKNSEGVEVIRLYYHPRLCPCAMNAARAGEIGLVSHYQCRDCHEVNYCTKDCRMWSTKACCEIITLK